jgi:hypothetical protein
LGISPQQLADLIELRVANAIGSSAGDELFGLLCETDDPAPLVANERADG